MKIKVLLFGIVADICNTDFFTIENIYTVGELKTYVKKKYPETKNFNFQISVNQEISDDNYLLSNNDEAALLPPFAGG